MGSWCYWGTPLYSCLPFFLSPSLHFSHILFYSLTSKDSSLSFFKHMTLFSVSLRTIKAVRRDLPCSPTNTSTQPCASVLSTNPRILSLWGALCIHQTRPSMHLCTVPQSPFPYSGLCFSSFPLCLLNHQICIRSLSFTNLFACNFPHPKRTNIKANKNNLPVIPYPSPATGSFICSLLHQNSLKELHCLQFLSFVLLNSH